MAREKENGSNSGINVKGTVANPIFATVPFMIIINLR